MSYDYSWCAYAKPKDQKKAVKVEVAKEDKPVKPLQAKTKLQSKTPIKKVSKKKSSAKRPKKELCIMPQHSFYKIKREEGLIRHEIFFGSKQRDLSIKYGLVIFIRPEQHTIHEESIHMNKVLDFEIKKLAQIEFEKKYPKLSFIEIFGKNYL